MFKSVLVIIFVSTLAFGQVYGQKKSKEDPKDAQIAALTLKLDSVSKELVKYKSVYDTLQKKVVHYKFDPAKTSFLIDSLRMKPIDSTVIKLAAARADTISNLKKELNALNATMAIQNNDAEKAKALMTQEEIDKAKTIGILKQYKELVDAKVLTEAEYLVIKKKYLDKL